MKSKLMNKEQLRMFAEMLNGEKQHCLFEDLVEERTGFKVLKPKQKHIEFLKTKGDEFKKKLIIILKIIHSHLMKRVIKLKMLLENIV